MITVFSVSPRRRVVAGLALAAGMFIAGAVEAQERHDRGHRAQSFQTPHMVFDDRYRHSHYYPTIGYSVSVLPPGHLSIGVSNRRFFFHGGVWFAPAQSGFVVVRPPLGAVVPALPPAYTSVWVAGAPYYYANETYSIEAPGGYAVTGLLSLRGPVRRGMAQRARDAARRALRQRQ